MRNKSRKPYIWLIVALCSAALLGLFFAPALADEAVSDGGAKVGVEGVEGIEIETPTEILDEFEGEDLLPEGEESFGQNFQATWIAAQEFSPADSGITYNRGPAGIGSFRCRTAGASFWFDAHIRLPSGARLAIARIFYDDSDADGRVWFWIDRTTVNETSGVPWNISQFFGPLQSPVGIGRWGNTAGNVNITIANRLQILTGRFRSDGAGSCFAGVRLFWNRQIRTGLPNPFVDIGFLPAVFQDSIKALAASGITTGTTPTTYSPNNNVTRAQMAVFLARALGLYWGYNSGF